MPSQRRVPTQQAPRTPDPFAETALGRGVQGQRLEFGLPEQSPESKPEGIKQIETVLSGIQDGFYILNSSWEFTFVNDRLCETVALPGAQILGRRIWDLFPEIVETKLHAQHHRACIEQIPVHGEYFYLKTSRWYYKCLSLP